MINFNFAMRASLLSAVAALALPAAALAAPPASTSTDAETTVANELSVSAPSSTVLGDLSHSGAATGSTVVYVTSTVPAWTLVASHDAQDNKGHMTRVGDGTALSDPVVVSAPDGGTPSPITAGGFAVNGTLNEAKTFNFSQSLAPGEDVLRGDVYRMTVTYTASEQDI